MNNIQLDKIVKEVVLKLNDLEIDFALVGGIAVSVRHEPRFTRDIDLAIAVESDEQAEVIIRKLQSEGYPLITLLEQKTTLRLATARLQASSVILDLLFASSGIEKEIVLNAESLEIFPNVFFKVATIGHLIAMKLLAQSEDRPQDSIDLKNLFKVADESQILIAKQAIELIEKRGFNRGRELSKILKETLNKNTGHKKAPQ